MTQNNRINRISEELTWNSYSQSYFIGNRLVEELKRDGKGDVVLKDGKPVVMTGTKFVNELQDAISAGIFDELVQKCADEYHGGDVQGVYYALTRNLDSTRYNLKKRAAKYAQSSMIAIDKIRLATMEEFVASRSEAKSRSANTTPQWAYGPTEIDAISDPDKLQKVINSINDVVCDKAHGVYEKRLGPNYVEVAKLNREYARKRKAELEAKANAISPDLLAKLAKGSKVTLSAEDAAKVLELLGKNK